jgi:hypothetical protein
MRDTVSSALFAIVISLTPVCAGVLASSSQAPNASSRSTLEGCLIDENEYASAYGLAPGLTSSSSGRQLVIVVEGATTNAPKATSAVYALTGPEENKLSTSVHRRVSLEGIVESGVVAGPADPDADPDLDVTPTPTGAVGVTPDGSPAHEPDDAIVPNRNGARARRPDERPAAVSELDRINVTGARVLGGTCGEALTQAAAAVPAVAAAVAPRPTPPTAAPVPATLTGCLVKRDDADQAGGLTLLAALPEDRSFLTRGAVPGSLPSGGGSGTVGTTGVPAREPVAYRLTGELGSLARYVGQRIEVTGIADPIEPRVTRVADNAATEPVRAETSNGTAHPTAVQHTLRVTSFRTAAGVCR